MTDRELMQLALEALTHLQPTALTSFYTIGDRDKAIAALREKLAQPETEAEIYKRLYELRGKALDRPCSRCGYQPKRIYPMAQPEQSRAEKMRDAGYTRRPTLREIASKDEQPEQEPVAWTTGWNGGHCVIRSANPSAILPIGIALYTTPPRREWVGLTEDEIDECYYWKDRQWTTDELVRHVEAKLREKNA